MYKNGYKELQVIKNFKFECWDIEDLDFSENSAYICFRLIRKATYKNDYDDDHEGITFELIEFQEYINGNPNIINVIITRMNAAYNAELKKLEEARANEKLDRLREEAKRVNDQIDEIESYLTND